MKNIRFFLLFLASIFTLSLASCDDKDHPEEPVGEAALPGAAKTFLSTYYDGVKINRIVKDVEDDIFVEYEVYLANGHDVTFDSDGDWKDVDAPAGKTIPDGIAITPITDYINAHYSGYGINEISKENYGYDVELTNGLDLDFDLQGNFIRVER